MGSHPLENGGALSGAARPTVLVVDDDDEMRTMLRLLCEIEGFEVVGEAEDGLRAAGLALEKQPSVVILDYLMPKLDGEQTAVLLRSLAPSAKIFVFSAFLEDAPQWADAFVDKRNVATLMPQLEGVLKPA